MVLDRFSQNLDWKIEGSRDSALRMWQCTRKGSCIVVGNPSFSVFRCDKAACVHRGCISNLKGFVVQRNDSSVVQCKRQLNTAVAEHPKERWYS